MHTTQHKSACKVLLHPTCITNPNAVRALQQATGQLVVINGGKLQLNKPFPANTLSRHRSTDDDFVDPFGGDAA